MFSFLRYFTRGGIKGEPLRAESCISDGSWHATVLHLLGLDHEKLTYYHNGIQRRLTDVHGQVIRKVLA